MNIAIISKKAHAKSHAEKLEALGHQVTLLGGSPTSIPSRYDVIVCRVVSCSHGASELATTARREGRKVIYEESVSRIVKAVEEIEKAQQENLDMEEIKTPVRGIFYRAYCDKRTKTTRWSIRSAESVWRDHVEQVTTRAAAEKRVAELDAQKLEAQWEQAEEKIVEAEPAVPVPRSDDLNELAAMIIEEMNKRALFRYEENGLVIELAPTHLLTPNGVACPAHPTRATSTLSRVSCEDCRASAFMAQAQWVLANMKTTEEVSDEESA